MCFLQKKVMTICFSNPSAWIRWPNQALGFKLDGLEHAAYRVINCGPPQLDRQFSRVAVGTLAAVESLRLVMSSHSYRVLGRNIVESTVPFTPACWMARVRTYVSAKNLDRGEWISDSRTILCPLGIDDRL